MGSCSIFPKESLSRSLAVSGRALLCGGDTIDEFSDSEEELGSESSQIRARSVCGVDGIRKAMFISSSMTWSWIISSECAKFACSVRWLSVFPFS